MARNLATSGSSTITPSAFFVSQVSKFVAFAFLFFVIDTAIAETTAGLLKSTELKTKSELTVHAKGSIISSANCEQLRANRVIQTNNPVDCQRLLAVRFSHFDFNKKTKNGTLVVLDTIAPLVSELMIKLKDRGFPLAKSIPISSYHGDDNASMADNNTSGFNGRKTTGSATWSLHAYGAAIDINPIQNPFISINSDGEAQIKPKVSARYAVNRLNHRPNKQSRTGMAEDIIDLFADHGFFIWGGDWNYPIDYQHFQIGPRHFVEKLVSIDTTQGRALLEEHIRRYKTCRSKSTKPMEQARKACIEDVLINMAK